jgi:hypothetical protein
LKSTRPPELQQCLWQAPAKPPSRKIIDGNFIEAGHDQTCSRSPERSCIMKPGNPQSRHPSGARSFDTRRRILHHKAVSRRGQQIRSGQEEYLRVWLALL